jgi:nucleoside-triphosphatase THEP1
MTGCEGSFFGETRRHARNKMIFVDGLPGSGKSTTAEFVVRELEQRGISCRLLRERETDHCGIRLLEQPGSESGVLCYGDGARGWGDRRRWAAHVAFAPW